MTNTTPNCYECRHRRDLIGDRHSQCVHPRALHGADALALTAARFCGMEVQEHVPGPALRVTAHAHGIAKGWFMWPFNFDPVWLVNCDGFEEKPKVCTCPGDVLPIRATCPLHGDRTAVQS
jgi:hypothetical protein